MFEDLHEHLEESFGDVRLEVKNSDCWSFFSPDRVRAKRTSLEAYKYALARREALGVPNARHCLQCGKEFPLRPIGKGKGRQPKLCSDRCRMLHTQRRQIKRRGFQLQRTCRQCGGQFSLKDPGNGKQKTYYYCTQSCSIDAKNAKRRDRAAPEIAARWAALTCKHCGDTFSATPKQGTPPPFCGQVCTILGKRAQKRKWNERYYGRAIEARP